LFAKGLIYGAVVGCLNLLLLYLILKHMVAKTKRFAAFAFFVSFVVRYGILGGLVYAFLRYRWGSPLGLLVGLAVGLVISVVWRTKSNDGTAGSS
jgi:ATP synthase I chain